MYHIKLEVDGRELVLAQSTGYLIDTIDGLTGVETNFKTSQNNIQIGVSVGERTIGGQTLVVRGKILDHNTAAKRALLSFLRPLAKGSLSLYDLPVESGASPYRVTDFIIKSTPKITQETHARFSFELFQPVPIWREQREQTITLAPNTTTTINVLGETGADFDWVTTFITPAYNVALRLDRGTPQEKIIMLRFIGDLDSGSVIVSSRGGRFTVAKGLVNGENWIKNLYVGANLMTTLPPGQHTAEVLATYTDGSVVSYGSYIRYNPSYVGVVLDGI